MEAPKGASLILWFNSKGCCDGRSETEGVAVKEGRAVVNVGLDGE